MKMIGDIPKWKHNKFHEKVAKKAGKAIKCESESCSGKSKNYNWALRKGHSYSDNPLDYIQLCISCHRKYDFTEEIREKLKSKKYEDNHIRLN